MDNERQLYVWVPRKNIIDENDSCVLVRFDNPEGFFRQLMMAMVNPDTAIGIKGDGE